MIVSRVFILFFVLSHSSVIIESVHFNGGTITWAPVDPYANSSFVVVTITQTYFWVLSKIDCKPNVPISTAGRENQTWPLICVSNCLTDGGYSTNPINTVTDCISSNPLADTIKSQRSKNVTIASESYFSIAHKDGQWRAVKNSPPGNWSIVTYINLRRRLDGIINTPPMTTLQSPQYVLPNRTTHIKIPVYDVNLGDEIRCRWAQNPGLNGANECDSLCNSNQLPNGTNLTDCVLTFVSTIENAWYGFTLQIDDYFNTTSKFPMSSTSIQFLIYVLANVTCFEEPVILPITNCLETQVGIPTNFTLFVMNYCNRTKVQITNVSPTMDIAGMNLSKIYNSTTNSSLSYVYLLWTPQINQIGSHQFCAIAYNSENVQSIEYCVTFVVKNVSNFCLTTTTTTTTSSSTTTTSSITTKTTTTISTTVTTTTKTSSNKVNIPLIVGLAFLALLLALCCCCCCFWLYYCLANKRRKRRQKCKEKDQLHSQVFTFNKNKMDDVDLNKSFATDKSRAQEHYFDPSENEFRNRRSISPILTKSKISLPRKSFHEQKRDKILSMTILPSRKTNEFYSSSAPFQMTKKENESTEEIIVNTQRRNTLTNSLISKTQRQKSARFSKVSVKRIRPDRSIHPITTTTPSSAN